MAKKNKGKEPEEELELDANELFEEGEKKVMKEAEETEKKVFKEIKKAEGDVMKELMGGGKKDEICSNDWR